MTIYIAREELYGVCGHVSDGCFGFKHANNTALKWVSGVKLNISNGENKKSGVKILDFFFFNFHFSIVFF